MGKAEVIAVLRECRPLYARIWAAPKYQPAAQEEECLKKLKQVFEAGWLDEQPDLSQAAGLEEEELAFLLGYVLTQTKPYEFSPM